MARLILAQLGESMAAVKVEETMATEVAEVLGGLVVEEVAEAVRPLEEVVAVVRP